VLESVVEHDRRHAEPLDRHARRVVPIGADHDRNPRQAAREEKGLVARLFRIETDRGGIGDDLNSARVPTVAAAHDTGPMAERGQ